MANNSNPLVRDDSLYALHKTLKNGFSLVRRVSDGRLFMAQDFNHGVNPSMGLLINHAPGLADNVAGILNHENMVSIVDAYTHGGKKVAVWDYCGGGTLAQFFRQPEDRSAADDLDANVGYLPEGLVWHVMLSVLKALAWLHEGARFELHNPQWLGVDAPSLSASWATMELRPALPAQIDWIPIYHRDIRAENIFLQQPRGIAHYGLCKLGNYGQVWVGNALPRDVDDPSAKEQRNKQEEQGRPRRPVNKRVHPDGALDPVHTRNPGTTTKTGDYGIRDLRRWYNEERADPTSVDRAHRSYTARSELSYLGAVLYRMMTGLQLAEDGACAACGCHHLRPPVVAATAAVATQEACPHASCTGFDVDLDAQLRDGMHGGRYAYPLRRLVLYLLRPGYRQGGNGGESPAHPMAELDTGVRPPHGAAALFGVALRAYARWRAEEPAGRHHVDPLDDEHVREVNLALKEARETAGDDDGDH